MVKGIDIIKFFAKPAFFAIACLLAMPCQAQAKTGITDLISIPVRINELLFRIYAQAQNEKTQNILALNEDLMQDITNLVPRTKREEEIRTVLLENRDLKAQEDMASWAMLMFWASAVATATSIAGIVAICITLAQNGRLLKETRKSNDLASAANKNSSDALDMQKPVLSISMTYDNPSGKAADIAKGFHIINHGATVANVIGVARHWHFKNDEPTFYNQQGMYSNAWGLKYYEAVVSKEKQTKVIASSLTNWPSKDAVGYFYGSIIFKDISGKVYTFNFCLRGKLSEPDSFHPHGVGSKMDKKRRTGTFRANRSKMHSYLAKSKPALVGSDTSQENENVQSEMA